jgi:ribosomal protein S21
MSVKVEVRNNNITGALKVLSKKLYDSGILQEYNEKRFYKKPSEKRNEIKQYHKMINKINKNK